MDAPDIAAVAALIGDTARARMLTALMGGRALTATELALEADIAPSTASSHLARLTEGGLVTLARQGRHRYFRIPGGEVAAMLEGLMGVASGRTRDAVPGPRDEGLRAARVCYDHLAGERAVRLLDALRRRRFVRASETAISLTSAGALWAEGLGIDIATLRARRRPLCRPCLDWSERRSHLAGAFGAALFDRFLALRYVSRDPVGRAVVFSRTGLRFVEELGVPMLESRPVE
jgi:DNA-binding transcriptional ArsR family regulator